MATATGIVMSKAMKDELPSSEKSDIEEWLWNKSGEKCFLCEEELNRASEVIEVDHDVPKSAGGKTQRSNLHLVHRACNRKKKDFPSIDIRPFLKLTAFFKKKGGNLKYGDCTEFFNVTPQKTVVSKISIDVVQFEFPDGSKTQAPIYKDKSGLEYTFVNVPKAAIYNDDDCQPRTLKLAHIWAIVQDLQINPLHEPPAMRVKSELVGTSQKLLMFDGQHKTVSYWLDGNNAIVGKVYLAMSADSAIKLVNSIQSKIKKLPLSPFELAAKLSDEWDTKLQEYVDDVGILAASEKEFFESWLPREDRARAKSAFQAALVQNVLSDPDLDFRHYVAAVKGDSRLTETMLKGKVLEVLLHLKPLPEKGEAMSEARERERQNIVRGLNIWTQAAFEREPTTDANKERMKRMLYQSSVGYISKLIKEIFEHTLGESEGRGFVEKNPTDDQWATIQQSIQRIIDHPIWTADLKLSGKTKAVADAFQKNQNAEPAFKAIDLRKAYAVGVEKLSGNVLA